MTKKNRNYSEITDEIRFLAKLTEHNTRADPRLYTKYDVKRGLRDLDGNGVLAGLTTISEVRAKKTENGVSVPCSGNLYYRGINIKDLTEGSLKDQRFGFEETVYLILFGDLPNADELGKFKKLLGAYRSLPPSFVRDVIMKAPSSDMMNTLSRSVLTLYSYDNTPEDVSTVNVLRQCLQLVAQFPLLSVYGYQVYTYYHTGGSLFIHPPAETLSTAENILHMLRPDSKYTELEARVLDVALMLHAEHGGGNNSSFTTRVVTSSGTDTYSVVAAALGSLKGPKHGGANIKVIKMIEDLKQHVDDWADNEKISAYLTDILNKKAFDRQGLIYGIGHAIYSVSDPRAEILRGFVEKLSAEKGLTDEYNLYARIEQLASGIITSHRRIYKGVSANVDFYSGFAYQMLGLPAELYTPIFAIARIAGWSAHRLEELISAGKIIRPAYKNIKEDREYIALDQR